MSDIEHFALDSDELDSLDNRTYLYYIKDKLNLSMLDFSDYIQKNPIVDVGNVKKNYVYLTGTEDQIEKLFTEFVLNELENASETCDYDVLYDIISYNIDIFIDITYKDKSIYIVELVK